MNQAYDNTHCQEHPTCPECKGVQTWYVVWSETKFVCGTCKLEFDSKTGEVTHRW